MEIIDLSQPLYDGMEVYPGDPEVHIKQIHTLDKEGWRLKYLQFSTHIHFPTSRYNLVVKN